MFNNRKYINQLMREIENLKEENKKLKVVNKVRADASDFWREKCYEKNQENENLNLSNNYLENKIKLLEKVIREHEENECRLNTELCRYKGMLDKIDSYKRMLEGRGINE